MKRPNILLLLPDQHRGDWMPYPKEIMNKLGIDKLPIKMPNIRKLMEEGVTFTRTVTPSPLCAPARACLASGLSYKNCNVANNGYDYPLDQRTFYSVLKEAKYNVCGVGKFDLHKKTHWWGLNGWIDYLGEIGFTHAIDNEGKLDAVVSGEKEPKGPYMKYLYDNGYDKLHIQDIKKRRSDIYNSDATQLPNEAYCDNWLTQNGINMLRQLPKGENWFMQVNFTGPHDPWDITQSMKEEWKDVVFPIPNKMDPLTKNDINSIRQNYAAMLYNIDKNIGMFIDEIKKRGELENTIIIYSSDHGEMLGDFDMFGKSKPQRASVHIPLVINGPGIRKGYISEQLVELQDLTSTIIEFAQCKMSEAKDSISLNPILKEGKNNTERKYITSALDNWSIISNGKYKGLFTNGENDNLFDIEKDPWENNNIACEKPEIIEEFKKLL